MKNNHDKSRIKKFESTNPALQRILKGIFGLERMKNTSRDKKGWTKIILSTTNTTKWQEPIHTFQQGLNINMSIPLNKRHI